MTGNSVRRGQLLFALSIMMCLPGCGQEKKRAEAAFATLFAAKMSRVDQYLRREYPQLIGLTASRQVLWSNGQLKGGIEYMATSFTGERFRASYDFTWNDGTWTLDKSSNVAQLFAPGSTGEPDLSSFSGPVIPAMHPVPEVDAIMASHP